MTLATSTRVGEPSARMVLLRGVDERGFGFFTNYDSQKGRDLAQNPRAALIMYWPKLGRQVRVAGAVVKQSPEESIAYFHNLPLPPNWGGYRVRPQTIEFWAHRDNRLHDRIRYSRDPKRGWRIERLAP